MAKTFENRANATILNPKIIERDAYSIVWISNVKLPIVLGPGNSHSITADPNAMSSVPGYRKSQRGL